MAAHLRGILARLAGIALVLAVLTVSIALVRSHRYASPNKQLRIASLVCWSALCGPLQACGISTYHGCFRTWRSRWLQWSPIST